MLFTAVLIFVCNLHLMHVLATGICDITKCSVTVYRECQNEIACGSVGNKSCAYLSLGLISNPKCAGNPCPAVIGDGNWQNICSGIHALEIKGPCNAHLSKGLNGISPYVKIFSPGFHGVWKTYENGVNYGNNALSVKLSCCLVGRCALNASNYCDTNAFCTDTKDSFNCTCNTGYYGDGLVCTDVDECLSSQHNCHTDAYCMNTIGSYKCDCRLGFFGNGTYCDTGNYRLVCKKSWMEMYLDKRTKLNNETTITLREKGCYIKRYMPNDELGLISFYKECGTDMKETESHIVYSNEIVFTYIASAGKVLRTTGKRVRFSCSLPRFAESNVNQLQSAVSMLNASEVVYGRFVISLWMFKTSNFMYQVRSFPTTVELNKRIYFEVFVNSNDYNIALVLDKCTASPSLDKNHPSRYYLIQNRCAKDSSVLFHSSTSHQRRRFSFRSFAFSALNGNAYLHCYVFLCHIKSTDARCTTGCDGNNIKGIRRRKSIDASSDLQKIGPTNLTLDQRPKFTSLVKRGIQNDYLPSKEYSLVIGPLIHEKKDSLKLSGSENLEVTAIVFGSMAFMLVIGFIVFVCKRRRNLSRKSYETKKPTNKDKNDEEFNITM